MDYEKKYNKLVEAIKVLQETNPSDEGIKNWVNDNVPELKELDDEKIRKGIISGMKALQEKGKYTRFANIPMDDVFVWLEKQGTSYTKRDVDDAYVEGMAFAKNELEKQKSAWSEEDEKIRDEICIYIGAKEDISLDVHNRWLTWLEKQGEQKPTDTVESKFKIGNWYQCTKDFFGKGVTFDKNTAYYCAKEGCLQCEYGCHIAIVKDLYDNFKLWDISDAKDGDVLSNGKMILIFKHFEEPSYRQHIVAYIGLDNSGNIQITDDTWRLGIDKAKPATKEQSDLLFQKMHETGYEWDADKKELKKIEGESENYKQQIMSEITDLVTDYIRQKPSWSEEDEQMIDNIIDYMKPMPIFFESTKGKSGKEYTQKFVKNAINWLKSLKRRTEE